MALNPKLATSPRTDKPDPIQYLTENAFRIIRRCDVDEFFPSDGMEHFFIVRDPDGYELDITVGFEPSAAAEIIRRSRRHITFESSFWINSAERHLAEYLWENNDFPPNGALRITEPNLTDLDLALRWNIDNQ